MGDVRTLRQLPLVSAVLALVVVGYVSAAQATCPPPGFDALQDFNISTFISAPWYVQQQMPVFYQRKDTLYCVRAQYTYLDPEDPEAGLLVRNYANKGKVNGPTMGTSENGADSWFSLTATLPHPDQPSKLRVGPRILGLNLPNSLRGDYWVVAAGNKAGLGPKDPGFPGYDWAIISGGAPSTPSNGACRTGAKWSWLAALQTNNIGLWLFSRQPVDPSATTAMLQVAKDLGFDTSVLQPVQQEGCTYEGA